MFAPIFESHGLCKLTTNNYRKLGLFFIIFLRKCIFDTGIITFTTSFPILKDNKTLTEISYYLNILETWRIGDKYRVPQPRKKKKYLRSPDIPFNSRACLQVSEQKCKYNSYLKVIITLLWQFFSWESIQAFNTIGTISFWGRIF